jgi:uncharacterized protein
MKFDFDAIKNYIAEQSQETRIYIGVDSERVKTPTGWQAIYTAAIVVHRDGKHGCKLFGEVTYERDYDTVGRPYTRLMMEVYKASELYLKLADILDHRPVYVHLDLNPSDRHLSSVVIAQAIGYIRGTCNIEPQVKPIAWAATYAADRIRVLRRANS